MKIFATLALLVLTTNLYAADCGELLSNGKLHKLTADNKFEAATQDFKDAWDMDDSDPRNHPAICKKLLSAADLFDDAKDFYDQSSGHLLAATQVCLGEGRQADAQEANEIATTTIEMRDTAQTFSNLIVQAAPQYCPNH